MAYLLMGRLIPHMSLLWAVILLSAFTALYLVVYIFWQHPSSYEYKHFHVGNVHNLRRYSNVGYSPSDSLEGEDNIVSEGKGVWISGRSIRVISAIQDLHHSKVSETRIVLPSFLQHSSNREFVCCFHVSDRRNDFTEVSAVLDFIDLRFIVDVQNAAFECILNSSLSNVDQPFQFISFAPRSCGESRSQAMRIVYPVQRSWEFAVCTKVAYGRLEPARLLEWFEYMREIGASKILTFHNNLHPDTRRVFDFYVNTGFLQLIEYMPQVTPNGSNVLYKEKNSQTRQARQDKTLVVRDCQFRLGGYDFILTIDFDELPVPSRPYGSLNWILQTLLRNHTDGAAFRMDPILLPPEWQNPVRNLYHWQFTIGTYIAPYCMKWAYIPSRTWMAATHEIVPKEGYNTYIIPQKMLHFLHFRSCKSEWQDVPCQNLTQTVKNELTLTRFTGGVLRNLRKLPLKDLVPDLEYVKFVRGDSRGSSDTKRHGGRSNVKANIAE